MVLLAVAVVRVRVVGRSDVLHTVDAAAFGAAFDGAVAIHLFCERRGVSWLVVWKRERGGGGRRSVEGNGGECG